MVLVAVALGGALLAWSTRPLEMSIWTDEATYLALSESLSNGEYRDEFLASRPLHAKYPPGNPAWILAVQSISGGTLDAVRAANLVLFVLTILLVADGVRRISTPFAGVLSATATAFHAALLERSTQLMSEAPFAFLLMLSAWAALRADSAPRRLPGEILASTAALASFLVRLNGVAAIVGVLAWLLVRRRWRSASVHAGLATLVLGGWLTYLRVAQSRGAGWSYAADLKRFSDAGQGLPELISHGLGQAGYYARILPSEVLLFPSVPGTPLDNLVILAVLLVGLALGSRCAAREWPALMVTLGMGVAISIVWSAAGPRFMVPFVPALTGLLFLGLHAAGRQRWLRAMAILGVGVAATLGLRGMALAPSGRTVGTGTSDSSYIAVAQQAAQILPAGAVLGASRYVVAGAYHHSGLRTVVLPTGKASSLEHNPTGLLESGKATALLVGAAPPRERALLAEHLLGACERLHLLAQDGAQTLLVGLRSAEASNACEAARAFATFPEMSPSSTLEESPGRSGGIGSRQKP